MYVYISIQRTTTYLNKTLCKKTKKGVFVHKRKGKKSEGSSCIPYIDK